MDKFKMLSGEELVTQGAKKVNSALPELGMKDVVSNGSWLEQKQIQSLLEGRRHIVEVERIEKCGQLSQAQWNEELQLAEVTKNTGSHWQYVGHNVGRQLYLYPEEALYLMELSCLQLKYNDVTVSIQQAYSLLLKDNVSLIQYKVYASLSRLGYKVLRHTYNPKEAEKEQPLSSDKINVTDVTEVEDDKVVDQKIKETAKDTIEIRDNPINTVANAESADNTINSNESIEIVEKVQDSTKIEHTDVKTDNNILSNEDIVQNTESTNEETSTVDIKENDEVKDSEVLLMETDATDDFKVSSSGCLCDNDIKPVEDTVEVIEGISNNGSTVIIQNKLEILSCRGLKPSNSQMVHQCFDDNLPDFYQKHIVTVKAPEEQLIPRNVFLNSTAYVLNLENLRLKSVTPAPSSSSRTYSVSDEADAHVGRIRSGYSNESAQTHFPPYSYLRFPQQAHPYRQFNYWNQFNYNWTFNRPFFPMPLRFQFFPRMPQMFRPMPPRPMMPNLDNSDAMRRARKRKRNDQKTYHLESIKKLAAKLKCLVASGNRQEQNIQALQRLINTYNVRYQARVELTAQLDIVENEVILDTINLDDDEQSSSKKKKMENMESYDENFNALKQFSIKIKELEAKKMLSTRHKRAFSNLIRTFNKSYNADVYVDSNFDVIDRLRIVIASSSDSECAVEEIQSTVEDAPKPRKSRKLRNPFYILKQLSEKQSPSKTSTVHSPQSSQSDLKKKFEYSAHLKKMFSKYWLPSEDDFGRAEVPLMTEIRTQVDHNEDFLCQFMRSQSVKFNNWLDAKLAYWQSCKEAALKYEARSQTESTIKLDSIIKPEDCTDLRNVLKKLGVIKTNKDVQEEGCLSVHFDVYNRDVPNFRKSKKPKPHFRVACIEESSKFPTGIEFATLHSKYKDDVAIVFAVVGLSSITHVQINSVDLPIYIPSNNLP